jgi:molybdopterin adenylyltransferase
VVQSVAPARIVAISVSQQKGTQKTNVSAATLVADWGVEGDAHAGKWHRQVSLLALESINTIKAKGLDVGPGDFAENITTAGLEVSALPVGSLLRLGECELEITQIGKECHQRCNIYYLAGDCVMPREGVFARVLSGGRISVGDPVTVLGERQGKSAKPERHN